MAYAVTPAADDDINFQSWLCDDGAGKLKCGALGGGGVTPCVCLQMLQTGLHKPEQHINQYFYN